MAMAPVETGQIATVVTFLEMHKRPAPAPLSSSPLRLARWKAPAPEKYRTLFRRVGENWLWFSRLVMTDEQLIAIIHDPAVEIFAICDPKGIEIGLLELDFRMQAECTIAFLGIVPALTGKGFGQWLMAQALMLGWRKGVETIKVQSCTLDHHAALPFYLKSGFSAVSRAIETFADPRLHGVLDAATAPQVPLLTPA